MANLPVYIMDGNLGVCSVTAEDLGIYSPLVFRGVVETYSDLPTDASVGDVYYVTEDRMEYVWDGSDWKQIEFASSNILETLTSFLVYPTSELIPATSTAADLEDGLIKIIFGKSKEELTQEELAFHPISFDIPAINTQHLKISSTSPKNEIDVFIDWGDGERTKLQDIDPELDNGTFIYLVSHTYEETNVPYRVGVYGFNYFAIMSGWGSIITHLSQVGSNVTDISWLLSDSPLLFNEDLRSLVLNDGIKAEGLLEDCKNLKKAYLPKVNFSSVAYMFDGDVSLEKVDIQMPSFGVEGFIDFCFNDCINLEQDISTLLPSSGFSVKIASANRLFNDCIKLYGTVPADVLWRDITVSWEDTEHCFEGCSEEIRIQVPVSWGGTSSEPIDKIATETFVEQKIEEIGIPTPTIEDDGKLIGVENGTFSLVEPEEDLDCTSFFVYANAAEIPVGSTHSVLGYIQESPYNGGASLPAQMTCKFAIRSETPNSESDVVVDWGDGTQTIVATDTLDWTQTDAEGEICNVVSHTYLNEGKYKVKIFGRDYFNISHWLGVATQNADYADDSLDYNKECNLLCDLNGLKIAPNLTNLASFARCSQRLTKAHVDPSSAFFYNVVNTASMFLSCWNLSVFEGVGDRKTAIRSCSEMFRDCHNMTGCDFVIPSSSNRTNYCIGTFYNCQKLSTPITSLLPKTGFSAEKMDFAGVFYCCAALTGAVPAWMLWESPIEWENTGIAFAGSSLAGNVPQSWGGNTQQLNDTSADVDGEVLNISFIDSANDSKGNQIKLIQDASNPLQFSKEGGRGYAYFFGNAMLALNAPAGGDFDFKDKNFSICYWVLPAPTIGTPEWTSVLNKRANAASADYYTGFKDYNPTFYTGGSADVSQTDCYGWHFVCYCVNASQQKTTLYVDGEQKETFTNYCSKNDRSYLCIGACCYSDNPMNAVYGNLVENFYGGLHDLRVYSKVLSWNEIYRIMMHTKYNLSKLPFYASFMQVDTQSFSSGNITVDTLNVRKVAYFYGNGISTTKITSSTSSLGIATATSISVGTGSSWSASGLMLYGQTVGLYGEYADRTQIEAGGIFLSGTAGINVYRDTGDETTIKGGTVTAVEVKAGTVSLADAVTEVRIAGSTNSLVSNGTASIPKGGDGASNIGLVYGSSTYGVKLNNGRLEVLMASTANITARTSTYLPIVPNNLNYAVTAALTDSNHITLTAEQQGTVQSVIGLPPASTTSNGKFIGVNNGTYSIVDAVTDAYIEGSTTSLVSGGTVTVPVVTDSNQTGVVHIDSNKGFGLAASADRLYVFGAQNNVLDSRTNSCGPVVSTNLDYAVRSVLPNVTKIPANTSLYSLLDASATTNEHSCNYSHVPAATPTYVLPDVLMRIKTDAKWFVRNSATDGTGYYGWINGSTNRYTSTDEPTISDKTYTDTALTQGEKTITVAEINVHEIVLEVRFSSAVTTYSFEDSASNTITPLSTPTISDGTVIDFLCRWSPLLGKWTVMPVPVGTYSA